MSVITILVPYSSQPNRLNSFSLHGPDESCDLEIIEYNEIEKFRKYRCKLKQSITIGENYFVKDEFDTETDLQIGAVIRTEEFDELFEYKGNDLGVTYRPEASTFKVWAPTATEVKIHLYFHNPEHEEIYTMKRQECGVWSVTIQGDLDGVYYLYNLCINLEWRKAVDPYAVALTVNSEYGVVINLAKTKLPRVQLPHLEQSTDAIIYETHIRDFSIHPESGIKNKGKYLGLVEKHTFGPSNTLTGLSYLVDLGVTHIELLPFNDFDGVDDREPGEKYNWGYNPLFFNVPEGSYATNPCDPYCRIRELKQAIHALHENKLRVIMDVVYNHVYIREQSPFEKIVPGYYFRHDHHGMPSNGTGVGNDIASERKMVRKFIIDSVLYWINEYHIDGFRFDLMGILDVETMNAVRRAIDEIDSSILLFGEGWDLNTPLHYDRKAIIGNAWRLPRIGQFNDRFRDGIKGSTFNLYDRGYALGNMHKGYEVKQSIAGSIALGKGEKGLFLEPTQSINYVESHDNHTLWDKICECNSNESTETKRKRQRLATTIVLLSQGIPFIHSGQEFYRTKQGVENSYNSPDKINQLDWNRKHKYDSDIDYIKGIIKIRKHHGAFRFSSPSLIRKHLNFYYVMDGIVCYTLKNVKKYGTWSNIMVLHCNVNEQVPVKLPIDDMWHVCCEQENAGIGTLYTVENQVILAPISTMVLFQP